MPLLESSERRGMRHVKDAQTYLKQGDSVRAHEVVEGLLSLAPRNPEALRLKAEILDGWGRFEESLKTLQVLSQVNALPDACVRDLERRSFEEREAIIYSELAPEGRWYFALPVAQFWISLVWFVGSALFLILGVNLVNEGPESAGRLTLAFVLFVGLPLVAFLIMHAIGVKRILIGLKGITVCTRFREDNLSWEKVACAVVEYDKDPHVDHLKLHVYAEGKKEKPHFSFDISRRRSVVKARRHFVRNILGYVDTVCYVSRTAEDDGVRDAALPPNVSVTSTSGDARPSRPDGDDHVA